MTEQDTRPWRTVTLKLPEPIACQLESALLVAELAGATNRAEAIEEVATEYIHGVLPGLMAQAKRDTTTKEGTERWLALVGAGWRCLICGTSRDLQCHHGLPRSAGGEDDERNLFPLCAKDHQRITLSEWPWKEALPWLRGRKDEQLRLVNKHGFITRKVDRTPLLVRYLRVGGDPVHPERARETWDVEHPNRIGEPPATETPAHE